jgi:mannose-1-phosphate guanylyltransferase
MPSDLNVMILCAGLGTRLRPLTLECAKPAVPLLNRPLVGYPLALAKTLGVEAVTINTHWLPETMQGAAEREASALGVDLYVSNEPVLLGTGGGLWQARQRGLLKRDRDVLVLNGDVLFDIDLERVLEVHRKTQALATMVLRPMPEGAPYSPVEADGEGRIRRIGKYGTPGIGPASLFSGVHVLSPDALNLLPSGESGVIEQVYAPLLKRGARVQAAYETGLWLDLGDPEGYLNAHLALLSGDAQLGALERHGILRKTQSGVSPQAHVDVSAQVARSAIGAGATVDAGAEIIDCVVWPGATVAVGERLSRTIVTRRSRVTVR